MKIRSISELFAFDCSEASEFHATPSYACLHLRFYMVGLIRKVGCSYLVIIE